MWGRRETAIWKMMGKNGMSCGLLAHLWFFIPVFPGKEGRVRDLTHAQNAAFFSGLRVTELFLH